jgi:hypothetical protein
MMASYLFNTEEVTGTGFFAFREGDPAVATWLRAQKAGISATVRTAVRLLMADAQFRIRKGDEVYDSVSGEFHETDDPEAEAHERDADLAHDSKAGPEC